MIVKKLIEQLFEQFSHGVSQEAEVYCYDGDSGQYEPITGFTFNPLNNSISLHTDEP